jgi:hypothetical protein
MEKPPDTRMTPAAHPFDGRIVATLLASLPDLQAVYRYGSTGASSMDDVLPGKAAIIERCLKRIGETSIDAAGQLAISVITLGELRHGAKKSQSPKKAFTATFAAAFATIEQLTNTTQIAVLDDHAGQHDGMAKSVRNLNNRAKPSAITTCGLPPMPKQPAGYSSPTTKMN